MAREKDITKPVNFEQISVKAVPPESSDRELSVVLDVGDLLRVAQVYQTSFCHLEAKIFILLGFVLRQGVVHVEAIEFDLVQPQGTIDKNPEKKTDNLLPKITYQRNLIDVISI